eukprot:TRINITY_DN2265_c0_g1_i3.p1 TRINITY_DN2265_c0_g1~~TRINITY_DN2265_c0_g1_i3.p1  ORF type:complete len:239 (-),score=98.46 TRINITY_DN2265_c0_g1_i3:119-835(-)
MCIRDRRIEKAEDELAKEKSLLIAAKEALQAVKGKVQELKTAYEGKLSQQQQKTQVQKAAKKDAIAKAESAKKISQKLQKEVTGLNAKLQSMEATVLATNAKAAKLQSEVDTQQKKIADAEKALAKAHADYAEKVAAERAKNKVLHSQNIELASKVTPLSAQRDAALHTANECQARYDKIVEGMKSVGKIADEHEAASEPETDKSTPPKAPTSPDEIVSATNAIVDAHTSQKKGLPSL